jgi:hypothetical protein
MMPLHLIKLAAGARGLDDLRGWQASRLVADPPLRHRTRNFPRRAAELLDGGSIYWVISQVVSVRQRLLDVVEAEREDGTACTDLVLDPVLVPVQGRAMRAFQGWRYLAHADAPADIGAMSAAETALPERLRRELAVLCLL